MNVSLFALLLLALVIGLYAFVQYRKERDHAPYDGSTLVVGSLPDYQPPVIRNPNGTFAKGSQPLAPRGDGGRFVKKAA